MKKLAIFIISVMLIQTLALSANAAKRYNKKPARRQTTSNKSLTIPYNGNDYLLKYNINDLEAAPWLNGGKRKI